jgi:Ni,Fe-hydrogenase I small subunit
VVGKLEAALTKDGAALPTVIWLACANCTGCTVSLANLIGNDGPADVGDLLLSLAVENCHFVFDARFHVPPLLFCVEKMGS